MAVYQLFINSNLVVASPGGGSTPPAGTPVISLDTFERNYEGPSELVFRCHCDWRSPPYAADSVVTLLRDEREVFRGLLDLPRPLASVRSDPQVQYTAHGLGHALSNPTVVDDNDNASIALQPATLEEVVNTYLVYVSETLTAYGVDPTVQYLRGAGGIQTFPVTLEAESVDGGFRRIAAAAPGVHLLLLADPNGGAPRYTFVNVWASPAYSLVMDDLRIEDLSIQRSIEGRAGAVRTLQGETLGSADVTLNQLRDLAPAWNPALEAEWTLSNAFSHLDNGTKDALADVYRVFSFAAFAGEITPDTPMTALVEAIPDEVNPRWQRVSIVSVNWNAKTVTLNLPAVKALGKYRAGRYNPNEPGRAKPAPVRLQFAPSGSASTPIIINSVRFPEVGFSGTAYQLAPITCGYEKIIQVPPGVNTEDYVRDAHAALSEPTASGSVPIAGDLPDALWALDRRVNVSTASHGQTGYESLNAPLMGVRLAFAAGGSATLELDKDQTELLREGA